MTTDGLAKLYTTLTVEERVRLVLLAQARGDDAEVQRLRDLEPAHANGLRRPQFCFRVIGLDNLVRCFYTDCAPWIGQLELLAAVRDPASWGGDTPLPKRVEDVAQQLSERLQVLLAEHARYALGRLRLAWDALTAVCAAEVNLEAETVIRALCPAVLAALAPYRAAMAALPEPEEPAELEDRAQWREAFAQAWKVWAEAAGAADA